MVGFYQSELSAGQSEQSVKLSTCANFVANQRKSLPQNDLGHFQEYGTVSAEGISPAFVQTGQKPRRYGDEGDIDA
jgi:hypothetical protein